MNSLKLYEINNEYEEILDNLYDENGEIDLTMLKRLEQNNLSMQEKGIAIASFIKNLEAESIAIDSAKKAMAEREKKFKKRMADLQGYLQENMERRGISKISSPYFEVKLKKCPPSVKIDDERLIPEDYLRVKTEVLPDKLKMLNEMKLGVIIPGATLAQGMRLEIK